MKYFIEKIHFQSHVLLYMYVLIYFGCQIGGSRASWASGLVVPPSRISTHRILKKFQHHLAIYCAITDMATLWAHIILQVGSFAVQKCIFRCTA